MFAILITEENIPKILKDRVITKPVDAAYLETCANKGRYFIRGYVSKKGELLTWTILPGVLFRDIFEYDATKIKTDWNIIVRRPAP